MEGFEGLNKILSALCHQKIGGTNILATPAGRRPKVDFL